MNVELLSAVADAGAQSADTWPWWAWASLLFVVSLLLGVVAVQAGVGGGVLYVPIVGGFFPFHLDIVRASGLIIAMATSLSASPILLRKNLADLRLALPAALTASVFSVAGAAVGLSLPTHGVQLALGATICGIATLFLWNRASGQASPITPDRLARWLGIRGVYWEESEGRMVEWTVHRTARGYLFFSLIGFLAGAFGLGAGWANVPVLNLWMGAPLKVAVGTSVVLLSATDTTAAWVYIHRGAMAPVVAIPSIVGIMLGSRIGVRLLARSRPRTVRWIVIALLYAAGLRAMVRGVMEWAG